MAQKKKAEVVQPTGLENFKALIELLENAQPDAEKTFNKNVSAGIRFRKALKEAKNMLQVIKVQSLEAKE